MQWWQWGVATLIAAVGLGLSIGGCVARSVYSRDAGEVLEKRLDELEVRERQDLSIIRDRIDDMYRMMVRKERER